MKREIFSRGVRMIHKFGELESRSDPLGSTTFELPRPIRVDDLSKQCPAGFIEAKTHGEHNYRPDSSPVCKPGGGYASFNGPKPDLAETFARPFPVGTKRRLGPPKTDR
jgi:hypothetical protein